MLIDADATVATFRPPPVEELTDAERRWLCSALAGAVDGWGGASQIGLRPGSPAPVDGLPTGDGAAGGFTWYLAHAAPVALALTHEAAANVLCVGLGAAAPSGSDRSLTEIDLSLLDAWAGRALAELVRALGSGPAGEVLRRPVSPLEMMAQRGPVIAAELLCANELAAGTILLGSELVRSTDGAGSRTPGDMPAALASATVAAEAFMASEQLPLADLITLEVGDVLLLGAQEAVEARLMVADTVLARARPGARDGVRALRVTRRSDQAARPGELPDGF